MRCDVSAFVSVATLLSLLGGCVQGPNYVKPTVSVPPAYRSGTLLQTGPSVTEDHWWTGYGDRHLDALVEEALANNRDLRIATARVDEFAAILAGTKA